VIGARTGLVAVDSCRPREPAYGHALRHDKSRRNANGYAGPYDKEPERFSYRLSLPLLRIEPEHRLALSLLYSFLSRILV
jgi:hypothetical protein